MFITLTNNKNIKSKIKNYTIDTSKYYIINKDNSITYIKDLQSMTYCHTTMTLRHIVQ